MINGVSYVVPNTMEENVDLLHQFIYENVKITKGEINSIMYKGDSPLWTNPWLNPWIGPAAISVPFHRSFQKTKVKL